MKSAKHIMVRVRLLLVDAARGQHHPLSGMQQALNRILHVGAGESMLDSTQT